MSEMNKTPRTLEHCRKISDDALGLEYVANELQYWAEKLEKENTALREQLKDCSAVVDRQQEQLDRNAERLAAQKEQFRVLEDEMLVMMDERNAAVSALKWLDALGGLGLDKHARIREALKECGK